MAHPNSQRFHELLKIAGETHDQKQQDYGRGDDPFANVRASEDLGIPGWVGAVLRNNDKQVRLQKAARDTISTGEPDLANEGVLDSLMDQAVYALIAYVLFEEWDKARQQAFSDMADDGWFDQNSIGEFDFDLSPQDGPERDPFTLAEGIDINDWIEALHGQLMPQDRSQEIMPGDVVRIKLGIREGEVTFVQDAYNGWIFLDSIGGIPQAYMKSEVELVG